MKRFIITLLTVLLVLSMYGCGKKGGGDNPKPTPTPKPDPVEVKFTSKLGTDQDVEKMLETFNAKYKAWSAFYADQEPESGSMFYDCWDDNDVYRGNYASYVDHGRYPVTELVVHYEGGKTTGTIDTAFIWLPYGEILDIKDEQMEPLSDWTIMCIKAILPDLTDEKVAELADRIAVPLEDAYQAFVNGQADPSELTKTSEKIYLPGAEKPAFRIGCYYNNDYKTIVLEFTEDN